MTGRMEGVAETKVYILSRDGKEIFRGTQSECCQTLRAITSSSPHRAFIHEGYDIKPGKKTR